MMDGQEIDQAKMMEMMNDPAMKMHMTCIRMMQGNIDMHKGSKSDHNH